MTSVILAGWCAAAAAALFRGPSAELVSLIPLAVAAGLSSGTVLFPAAVFLFSLCLIAPDAIPWAVLAGSLLFSLSGRGTALRITGFLMAACILWVFPVRFSVPVLLVSAAGAIINKRPGMVYLGAAGIFVLSAMFFGIPERAVEEPAIAICRIENGTIFYETEHLYTDCREVLLPAPVSGRWLMWLAVDPGGVRDTLPMMAVSVGEDMIFLPAGADTLCFTFQPGDTLSVRLMRGFRPFVHPTVHVSAGGEML